MIQRSYGELGLELPTQVESKIERKSEQNSVHDLLVISALQRLENTEAGHSPAGQSSNSYRSDQILGTIPPLVEKLTITRGNSP